MRGGEIWIPSSQADIIDHWLVCDLVGTQYPRTKLNFAFDVSAAQGNNYGIDPEQVYWSVVNSIQWTH